MGIRLSKNSFALIALVLFSFFWFYFFLSGLSFNPMYGDDHRSLYLASDIYSLKSLTQSLFSPFPHDYYSRYWVVDRPVYYFVLKLLHFFFESDPFWHYLQRVFNIVIIACLLYVFLYQGTKSVFFSFAGSVSILTLPSFFYTTRHIADNFTLGLVFFLIALLFLLKFPQMPYLSYYSSILLFSYLAIKTHPYARLLLPVVFCFFVVQPRFVRKHTLMIALLFVFLILLTIPIKNPFQMEEMNPPQETSLLKQLSNLLIQKKTIAEPYGIEQKLVFFQPPFPFIFDAQGNAAVPFSLLSSLGTLFVYFFLLTLIVFVWRLVKLRYVPKPTPYCTLLFSWTIFATLLLGVVATKSASVELPRYVIFMVLPFVLFLFYVLAQFGKTLPITSYKKIWVFVLAFIVVHHVATGFFYDYRMRGIDGHAWYAFNEATKAILEHENLRGPLLEILFANQTDLIPLKKLLIEHYNYAVHPILTPGTLTHFANTTSRFYILDSRWYEQYGIPPYTTPKGFEQITVKEIILPLDDPYVRFQHFIQPVFGRETKNNIATLYQLEKRNS